MWECRNAVGAIAWTIDEPKALKNHGGFHYQKEIFERWTEKELNAIGIYSVEAGTEDIKDLKEKKIKEISECYHQKSSEGFVWNGKTFDIDIKASSNINAELMFQSQSSEKFPKEIIWRGYENQDIKMKKHEFVDFASAARAHLNLLRKTRSEHEKSISRKRSVKTINNYDLTKKWPETAEDSLSKKVA